MSVSADRAEATWRALRHELRAFVARRVPRAEDVDDVLQEVMLRIHRSGGALEREERLMAWIHRIAANAIADHYRRPARREIAVGGDADVPEPPATDVLGHDPEPEARAELSRCLVPLLERLAPAYREALELTELEGLSQVDAAGRLGLSVSGMKARVQRGRRQLRELLLDCCHVELDRRGGVIEFTARHRACRTCGAHLRRAGGR